MIKITKEHPDFKGIRWAIRAVGNEKSKRLALTHLLFTETEVVGCDGHRLHCYQLTTNFPSGQYEVVKNDKKRGIELVSVHRAASYPDYDVVFPKSLRKAKPYQTTGMEGDESEISVWYTRMIRCMNSDETLNFYYYADIADLEFPVCFYVPTSVYKPLFFTNFFGGSCPNGHYCGLVIRRKM